MYHLMEIIREYKTSIILYSLMYISVMSFAMYAVVSYVTEPVKIKQEIITEMKSTQKPVPKKYKIVIHPLRIEE
jgi:hypothetical protein